MYSTVVSATIEGREIGIGSRRMMGKSNNRIFQLARTSQLTFIPFRYSGMSGFGNEKWAFGSDHSCGLPTYRVDFLMFKKHLVFIYINLAGQCI
jgi:hypothetical protein